MNYLEVWFDLNIYYKGNDKDNHLSIPPEKLYLRFQVMPVTTYKFTCFSVVQNNVNLDPIYDFLCSTPIDKIAKYMELDCETLEQNT